MLIYAKYLKNVITNKRRWDDKQTVELRKICSSIISYKILTNLKDPGRFTIPYIVSTQKFSKCLCDLKASIDLMPLSLFRKLQLGELSSTNIIFQLADHSIKKPHGIVEDVIVKVNKFIFIVNFVVLDFEEDKKCPLILRRPFLSTSRALIHVHEGKITLRVSNDSVEFVMSNLMKYHLEDKICMKVKVMDACVKKVSCPRVTNKKVKVSDENFKGKQENTFEKPKILLGSDNRIPVHLKCLPNYQYLPKRNMKKRKKRMKKRPKFNQPKQVKHKDNNKSCFKLMLLREKLDERFNELKRHIKGMQREQNYYNYKFRNFIKLLGHQVPSSSAPGSPS